MQYELKLFLNDKPLTILVCQKKMKSIRLKITSTGDIVLSTPLRYTPNSALEFVKSKQDWISKTLSNLTKNKLDTKCEFNDTDSIYIWGEKRTISVNQSTKNDVELDGQILHICYTKNSHPKQAFLHWAKSYFFGNILDMFEIVYRSIFKKLNIKKPEVVIRPMKSMWGNCKYNRAVITFNLYLLKVPKECVNYVILHELAHMIYHNHGAEFKAFLTRHMPNWKEIKKQLNKYSLQF